MKWIAALFLAPLFLAPSLAWAECPAVPDRTAEEDQLYSMIQAAPNQAIARELGGALWTIWTRAPDAKAQAMLDIGVQQMRISDFEAARRVLDQLIEYCPHYAEGWNQRAFSHYLQQNFEPALADLDRAEELNPRHTGILTGKALTLIGMGRAKAAQEVLRRAVDLNPWLSERALLVEPEGEDI
ncbi:MAG: tetratricopeptide repeat protein [Shimia sp.]